MEINDLKTIFKEEPSYRYLQAFQAIFKHLINNWDAATNLPLSLRQKLNKEFPLQIQSNSSISPNEIALKCLITLDDGLNIETVLMKHKDGRNTVCVSSQVGCPLGCVFCRTGTLGFKRNLNCWEIVEQVLYFARLLKKEKKVITNIVYMGMGEPFLNYNNVVNSIKLLNDKDGFNLGIRNFSVSSVGIPQEIDKLSEENLGINLAISLHSPNNKLRSEIMPINKKYPIEVIMESVIKYISKTKRKVMFEYIMIDKINDSQQCARELGQLLKGKLCLVNLIPYNETGIFKPSDNKTIKEFRSILEKEGIIVTQRFKMGEDIKAACGQLAGQNL